MSKRGRASAQPPFFVPLPLFDVPGQTLAFSLLNVKRAKHRDSRPGTPKLRQ